MIAHRLSTIECADELLFFKSSSELISARKGTEEYEEIMDKLRAIQYAYGEVDDNEDEEEQQIDRLSHSPVKLQSCDLSSNGSSSRLFPRSVPQPPEEKTLKAQQMLIETGSKKSQPLKNNSINKSDKGNSIDIYEAVASNTLKLEKGENPFKNSQDQMLVCDPSPRSENQKRGSNLPFDFAGNDSNGNLKEPASAAKNRNTLVERLSSLFDLNEDDVPHNLDELQRQFKTRSVKFTEIMRDYAPKWLSISGVVASVFCSLQMPLFGFVLSKYIFVLISDDSMQNFVDKRNFWTMVFALLCVGKGISSYLQKLCFALGGERLTYNLRVKFFSSLMHKSVGWFDNKHRAPGVLTKILTEDINSLNGLTTESVAVVIESALGLFFSCLICVIFSWRVALVVTCTCPFMVLGGIGQAKLQFNQRANDESSKAAAGLLNDIILNYRTVISLGKKNQELMLEKYESILEKSMDDTARKAHYQGLFFAYTQSIRFIYVAFVFYIAAVFAVRY